MLLFIIVKVIFKCEIIVILYIKIILDKMFFFSNLLVYLKICFRVIVINIYFKNILILL